ncbi:UNVERIFIED_CONTAM: hypothetical protein LK11_27870 [Mumia flava]
MLLGLVVLVVASCVLSVLVGSGDLGPGRAWQVLWRDDGSDAALILRELRVPRTVVALLVGVALGVAGALAQSLTRNPLADPGLLGINAGASLAVVLVFALTGVAAALLSLSAAWLGAGLAAAAVYALGSVGRRSASPARLALAGIAFTAAVTAIVQGVVLLDQQAFNEFRFWIAGSLQGRGYDVAALIAPFVLLGVVTAVVIAPSLNALALGDEAGRALGASARRTRGLAFLAIVLLCGSATAAAGPIAFVGLGVPFLARAWLGSDQRWVMPACVLLGPVVLLVADVLARIVVAQEVPVGIVTALLGGPLFLAIVVRPRIEAL